VVSQGEGPTLDVLTPSYGPDLDLCRDLVGSVGRFAGPGVRHTIVVPPRDVPAFADLAGARTRVVPTSGWVPRSLVPLPANLHLNLRHPWLPVRGWVTQQIVKLGVTAESDADVVLLADSDLLFVRPFDATDHVRDVLPLFYRLPGGVHDGLPRHLEWHRVARRLLGLPAPVGPPLPDYVCWPCPWSPAVVRDMLARIEQVQGTPWPSAVARCRHFSEMILYGVYVDEVLEGRGLHATEDMRCPRHTSETELGESDLRDLVGRLRPDDVAVMVTAKSPTPLATRRRVLSLL
jgi:hypothetical protein